MNQKLINLYTQTVFRVLFKMLGRIQGNNFDAGSEILFPFCEQTNILPSLRFFVLLIECLRVWKTILPKMLSPENSSKFQAEIQKTAGFYDLLKKEYYLGCDVRDLKKADQQFFADKKKSLLFTLDSIQYDEEEVSVNIAQAESQNKLPFASKFSFREVTDEQQNDIKKQNRTDKNEVEEKIKKIFTFYDLDSNNIKKTDANKIRDIHLLEPSRKYETKHFPANNNNYSQSLDKNVLSKNFQKQTGKFNFEDEIEKDSQKIQITGIKNNSIKTREVEKQNQRTKNQIEAKIDTKTNDFLTFKIFDANFSQKEKNQITKISKFVELRIEMLSYAFQNTPNLDLLYKKKAHLQDLMNELYPEMEEFLFSKNPLIQPKQEYLLKELNFVNSIYDVFSTKLDFEQNKEKGLANFRECVLELYRSFFGVKNPEFLQNTGILDNNSTLRIPELNFNSEEKNKLHSENKNYSKIDFNSKNKEKVVTNINDKYEKSLLEPEENNGLRFHAKPLLNFLEIPLTSSVDRYFDRVFNPFSNRKSNLHVKIADPIPGKAKFCDSISELDENKNDFKKSFENSLLKNKFSELITSKLRSSSFSDRKVPKFSSNIKINFGDKIASTQKIFAVEYDSNKENLNEVVNNSMSKENSKNNDNDEYEQILFNSKVKFQKVKSSLNPVSNDRKEHSRNNVNFEVSNQKNVRFRHNEYEISELMEPEILTKLEEDNSQLREKKKQLESDLMEMSSDKSEIFSVHKILSSRKLNRFDRTSLSSCNNKSTSFRILQKVGDASQLIDEFNRKEDHYSILKKKYETLKKKMQGSHVFEKYLESPRDFGEQIYFNSPKTSNMCRVSLDDRLKLKSFDLSQI